MAPGSKILVTWFKLIYWGRAGLNSASFSEWVWRTLKLTVKRFKGLSYLCFLLSLHSPQLHLLSLFLLSMPAQYASPISLFNGTFTNRRESITRSGWATSKLHLCSETVFSQVDLYFKWDFLADWYRIDNETKGWRLQRKNNFQEVDLHVNLKSKKLSLCSRLGRGEVYDCEMSLFCMPSGEKVYAIDARSTKCGKKVRVWSFFWIAEY